MVVWAATIFYFSSIPSLKASQNPALDEVVRTLAHFFLFGLGYFLLFRAINFSNSKKNFLLPLFLAFFYGLSDEIHQSFVPTRTFKMTDLAVDFGGAFIGKIMVEEVLIKFSGWFKWRKF